MNISLLGELLLGELLKSEHSQAILHALNISPVRETSRAAIPANYVYG
jgi:hypothetical protein